MYSNTRIAQTIAIVDPKNSWVQKAMKRVNTGLQASAVSELAEVPKC